MVGRGAPASKEDHCLVGGSKTPGADSMSPCSITRIVSGGVELMLWGWTVGCHVGGIRAVLTLRKRLAKSIGNGETGGSPAGNDKVIAVEKVGGFALDEMLCTGPFCLGNDALGEKH